MQAQLPTDRKLRSAQRAGDHRYLWEGFSFSTINGQTPQANELASIQSDTPASATAIPVDDTWLRLQPVEEHGTASGRFLYVNPDRGIWQNATLYKEFDRVQFGGQDFIALRTHTSRNSGGVEPQANMPPNATFWQLAAGPFTAQDHAHSPTYIVDTLDGAANQAGLLDHRLNPATVTNARQSSHWNPLTIVNGDFDNLGDQISEANRRLPGWTDYASAPQFDSIAAGLEVATRTVLLSEDQHHSVTHKPFCAAEASGWQSIFKSRDSVATTRSRLCWVIRSWSKSRPRATTWMSRLSMPT